MEILTVFLIAVGLSFDTFAVSVSCGLIHPSIVFRKAILVAFPLAFFQASMPLLGWLLGSSFRDLLENLDHWIAFLLLCLIGGKMIFDSLGKKDAADRKIKISLRYILGISLATSIDAFVIGITFGLMEINIWVAAVIIGVVTFLVAMLGIFFGKKAVGWLGRKMEIAGGIILILIGLKIFLEHQYFA